MLLDASTYSGPGRGAVIELTSEQVDYKEAWESDIEVSVEHQPE